MNFGTLGFPQSAVDGERHNHAYLNPGGFVFVVPDGVYELCVSLYAASGGGGGGTSAAGGNANGGNSGRGGRLENFKLRVYPGLAIPVKVGTGGTGGAANTSVSPGSAGNGTAGEDSWFGPLIAYASSGGGGASDTGSSATAGSHSAGGSVGTRNWQEFIAETIPGPSLDGSNISAHGDGSYYGKGASGGSPGNTGINGTNGSVFLIW